MTSENIGTTSAASNIDMDSLMERLIDAHNIPGYRATFTDEEAAFLGAFEEDAISDESAMAGSFHNPDLIDEVERELA